MVAGHLCDFESLAMRVDTLAKVLTTSSAMHEAASRFTDDSNAISTMSSKPPVWLLMQTFSLSTQIVAATNACTALKV